ncbi:MAG: YihY/virulence factor BrkB family protein [Polyangiaceae bacterium]
MHPALRTLRTIGSAAKNLYFGHGAEWAAALAYYSLLSVFPGALLGVTVASLFVDQGWAMQQIVGGVGHLLPTVSSVVAHDVSEAIAERGQVSVLALVFLAWTGSRVFSTLTHALDQALGRAPRHEGFFLSLAREVLLLGLTGVVLLVGTFAGLALDLAARALPFATQVSVTVATALARTLLFGGALVLVYSFIPFPRPPFRAAASGAMAATGLLVVAMPLFSAYVTKLGQYNLVYGPVAIVMVVLVWFWLASVLVLFGAHVAAILEGSARREAPPEHPQSKGDDAPPPPAEA